MWIYTSSTHKSSPVEAQQLAQPYIFALIYTDVLNPALAGGSMNINRA